MHTPNTQDTCISLITFLLHTKQQIAAVATNYELTFMQTLTLLLTNNDYPRSMNSFTKLYMCDASNVTGIVDGLEQKGLVSRQNHPNDRRIKIIHLEPSGIELRQKLITELNRVCDSLFDVLDNEKEYILRALSKVNNDQSDTCIVTTS